MKGDLTDRLRRLGAGSRRALVFSAVVGVLTGAGVALFEWVTRDHLLDPLRELPLAVQVVAPTVGLALAALSLRWLAGGASPATADEYIRNFHDREHPLDPRPAAGRMVAAVSTLGLGGALGFEGPSLYLGASIGSAIQQRWHRIFTKEDSKLLMVAGAAAGVAAIFKSPATGAVFALEVPYQDDNASRLLLPALLASAVSYLTFVTFSGTTPLFAVAGTPALDLRDLGGALALGIVCGLGARLFAVVLRFAKRLANRGHPMVRVAAAGATLAVLYGISYQVYGHGYSLGAGYSVIEWATQPDLALGLIVLLFAIRLAAVSTTLAGGGVGGLFVPLVVAGALTGRAFAALLGDPTGSLFLVIGVAAFLGAGYRTPLAGVIFVAESTGQPGFVVPGLIASVAAQLMMGGVSVSPYQRGRRVGRVDERREPIGRVVDHDWPVTRPGTTVADLLDGDGSDTEQPLPVVAGTRYLGVVTDAELRRVPEADRATTLVTSVMRHDWPTARPTWSARTVAPLLETAGVDALAVTDDDGRWVGWLTADHLAD